MIEKPAIQKKILRQDLKYLSFLAKQGKGYLHPHGKPATECLINSLNIENGNKLLEIGCGTGGTMVRILSAFDVTIDGIDILPEMIKKANVRLNMAGLGKKGRIFGYSGHDAFPFENNSYDRVYAESVLGFQNEADVKNLLVEAYRVLKNGGVFAANDAVWKKGIPPGEIDRIYKSSIEDFGLAQASRQPWTADDWICAFKSAGFEILSSGLLSDMLPLMQNGANNNFKRYISETLSKYFYLKSLLKHSSRKEHAHYKKLLDKHSGDGSYIESRLFVLRKN